MNNAAFEKMMKNLKKYRDIKLATTERSRNYLVSKPNYHTTNIFTENLLALEMKKIEILTNEPVFVGLLMLELSKILMYESWYDYVKSDYGEKAKLCYMDTDSFIIYIKADDIYKDIAEDAETRIDT